MVLPNKYLWTIDRRCFLEDFRILGGPNETQVKT